MLNEHDAKAVGRADASTATDTEPSAIAFNIGGLAAADGTNVMIGGAVITPAATFTDPSGTKTDTEPLHAVLPHLYLTSRVNDVVALGIGFHAPFGLEITWPDATPGVPNSSPNLDVVKFQIAPYVLHHAIARCQPEQVRAGFERGRWPRSRPGDRRDHPVYLFR